MDVERLDRSLLADGNCLPYNPTLASSRSQSLSKNATTFCKGTCLVVSKDNIEVFTGPARLTIITIIVIIVIIAMIIKFH